MSEVKVNKISPRSDCGTTALGDSGDTFNIPCGSKINVASGGNITVASGATITNNGTQTGFGRTGTVDWDTSIKTGTVTAVSGSGYFVNTTAGEITVNLPAAAVGSIVAVSDYASTANTNNIVVSPNGSEKINGENEDYPISTNGLAVTLVYADATRGWKSVTGSDADATGVGALFVVATGGTPCTGAICGNFKTHVFTGPGTLTISCGGNVCGSNTIDYTVVAGGGGSGSYAAGGGGAGGFRVSNSVGCIAAPVMSPLANPTGITTTGSPYPITVGAAGAAATPPGNGYQGGTSTFDSISSAGGGGGKGGANGAGSDGGSGGGGKGAPAWPGPGWPGGASAPVTSPAQGQIGGPGWDGHALSTQGGGGGGAGGVGGTASHHNGGPGGIGSFISDTFLGPVSPSYGEAGPVTNTRYFSGGGGGGTSAGCNPTAAGGDGGGGTGGVGPAPSGATAGTTNMGGGGGGGGAVPTGTYAGGSGIVIIRYKFQ